MYLILDTLSLGASAPFRRGCCILGFGAQGTVQVKVRNLEMISVTSTLMGMEQTW